MAKFIKRTLSLLLLLVVVIAAAGCPKKENVPPIGPDPVITNPIEITLTAPTYEIQKGETVKLTVTVSNAAEDSSYTYQVSDSTLVNVDHDNLIVIGDTTIDKIVTVTVISNEDTNKSVSKTFKVIAPHEEGRVGDLTSDMLVELGNPKITVSGTLTDYYKDYHSAANDSTHIYDISVEMSEGKWNGSWNIKGDKDNKIVDRYRIGSVDGLTNANGEKGHGLERAIIDKDNQVATRLEKNYVSIPELWESSHLWNHLGNLQITKFTYDAENLVYKYNPDWTSADDNLLMGYLALSLTPLLTEQIVDFYLKIEEGKITEILAETEKIVYGEDPENDPDALSYTDVKLTISGLGTTVAADPTPYEAPEYAEVLTNALNTMKEAKNYTFSAKDVTTHEPSYDDSEYSLDSVKSSTARTNRVTDSTSSRGTVGQVGYVTKDAVLYVNTTKYNAALDDKLYVIAHSGLKQNSDGTYDEFKYDPYQDTLVGTRKVKGSIFDALPGFDFSPNAFHFESATIKNGKTVYNFAINDSAITRDIALEIAPYGYSKNAAASATTRLKISVDSEGHFVGTTIPYDINGGMYIGYVTTSFSAIGTTVLDEDLFDGYVPRVLKASWNDYTVKYYSPTFSTQDTHEEAASVVFDAVYGASVVDMPSPATLLEILGDNIFGPFYDWDENGFDADGNQLYKQYVSITVETQDYDENMQMLHYEELMNEIQAALEAEGFAISRANTDTTGGETGRGNRYVCFIKNDIQIVIENNHTKYLWIYFYKTGDWSLNK